MDKKELQKAQNIIDALFYDDKALTQWQHTLLENVISIAQTKLRQPDVSGRSELLIAFANELNEEAGFPLNSEGFEEFVNEFLSKQ